MNDLSSAIAARSRLVINVEADDRTVLFPDGKFLTHIAVSEDADGGVRLDAVFLFNETRLDTRLAVLDLDDARDFARALLDAVFQGRTQHVLSDVARIAVIFNPNGFVLKFGEERALKELFIASPAIVRLSQGLLRMVDRVSALPPH
ncbi:hypothetical protein [Azospirillum sp.]|uniref:hypothetical protein n=1 Tax=Azospirillum sp. TaxID=34012 RepID=UPI003D72B18F